MRNWKKALSLFLCLVMCLSVLSPAAVAEETETNPAETAAESCVTAQLPEEELSDFNTEEPMADAADGAEDVSETGYADPSEALDEIVIPEEPGEPELPVEEPETEEPETKELDAEEPENPEEPADILPAEAEVLEDEGLSVLDPDQAEIPEYEVYSEVYINPLYADVLTEADLIEESQELVLFPAEAVRFTTMEDAGRYMRSQMEQRQETIAFAFQRISFERYPLRDFFDEALLHTGSPKEGDYLKWQYGGWRGTASYKDNDWWFSFTLTYYTTAEQEQEMDRQVASILSQLQLDGMSAIEKVKLIYQFVAGYVTYDYNNLYDNSYRLKYTAYAALVNRTAVCQGYAVLLYRLLLASGIECRVITGKANGGNHAWNIIRIGNLFYNVDNTWDSGARNLSWFLLCDGNFKNHTRNAEYATPEFYSVYPMSDKDYSFDKPDPVDPGGGGSDSGDPDSGGSDGGDPDGGGSDGDMAQFLDVRDPSQYYYKPVYWAYRVGITSGTSNVTFSPGNPCTRGQIVTFLWKALGSPEPSSTENPFTDVRATDYFYKPVLWAKENGVTSGTTATTFSPGNPCTRGQISTFLWKAMGSPEPTTAESPFEDVRDGDYFLKSVLWAKENGITSGTSATTFSPFKPCTRAQAMTFLWVASGKPEN